VSHIPPISLIADKSIQNACLLNQTDHFLENGGDIGLILADLSHCE